jgi:glucose/arabinose dehydrogenase
MNRAYRRCWPLVGFAFVPAVSAQLPADLALTLVASDVGSPVGVRHAGDGSGRLFIIDREGSIRVKPANGAVLGTRFLTVNSNSPHGFNIAGEGGLLGLAFHPDYETNRYFYVHYSSSSSDSTIVRYRASVGDPNVADAASATVILRADADAAYHKGGDLHFGPDGYLYISIGDGAGGTNFDHCRRGQSRSPADLAANDGNHGDCPADSNFTSTGGNPDSRAFQGKILRIDVDATTPAGSNELCGANDNGSANYAIPPGNPYAGPAGGAGNCDEIWAYGLRNPFRFSFDRTTGDMFIGDVGEGEMEEIDYQPAGIGGRNYGWYPCEGTLGNCPPGTIFPILTYTHSANGGTCSSISGGFRYRGAIPGMRGMYVYADYCSGKIHFANGSGTSWNVMASWSSGPQLNYAGFGEDEVGELYLVETSAGRIRRFTSDTASEDLIFENGFQLP